MTNKVSEINEAMKEAFGRTIKGIEYFSEQSLKIKALRENKEFKILMQEMGKTLQKLALFMSQHCQCEDCSVNLDESIREKMHQKFSGK